MKSQTTEFFTASKGLTKTPLIMINQNKEYTEVAAMDDNFYKKLELQLFENDKARHVLTTMRKMRIQTTNERINTFIHCNFGNLDHTPDIDAKGNFHFENVKCRYKAANMRCPYSTANNPKPYCIKKF